MKSKHIQLGQSGETAAQNYLLKRGYKIISHNYRNNIGEIDFIAINDGCLCFVEVKTRNSDALGLPLEAIDQFKQIKISRTALKYLQETNCFDQNVRFDCLGIIVEDQEFQCELIKNAFEFAI